MREKRLYRVESERRKEERHSRGDGLCQGVSKGEAFHEKQVRKWRGSCKCPPPCRIHQSLSGREGTMLWCSCYGESFSPVLPSILRPNFSYACPPSSIQHHLSIIVYPLSSIRHRLSIIIYPSSSINYHLSVIVYPSSSIRHHLSLPIAVEHTQQQDMHIVSTESQMIRHHPSSTVLLRC